MSTTITKVLVANRGEIASRIIRTCKAMGIRTVAVYSSADSQLMYVGEADESYAIPSESSSPADTYLDGGALVEAARLTGCDAVHPGYGFLSENSEFAGAVARSGLAWLGPSPASIALLGSKRAAKGALRDALAVPLIPGYSGADQSDAAFQAHAGRVGYPLLLKASAGGGGKGMRVVRKRADLLHALDSVRTEAANSFGDATLLMERYFDSVKHIEFQILGDTLGDVIDCHERECSVQRRHQKVIEETPSPFLTPELRQKMRKASIAIGKLVGYVGAGTVEFIVDCNTHEFFFLEVNTRLQVEHTVTEQVTGVDLVECQIRVARGESLRSIIEQRFEQTYPQLRVRGHSIQARVCAEDPKKNFFPSVGPIHRLEIPKESPHVRVERSIRSGSVISVYYDSMMIKLVCWDVDRTACLRRTVRSLEQLVILGPLKSNQQFLKAVLEHPVMVDGSFDTHFIEDHMTDWLATPNSVENQFDLRVAATLYDWIARNKRSVTRTRLWPNTRSGFRNVPLGEEKLWAQYVLLVPPEAADQEPLVPTFYKHTGTRDTREHFLIRGVDNNDVVEVSARMLPGDRIEVTIGSISRKYVVARSLKTQAYRGEDEWQLFVHCLYDGRNVHYSKRSKLYLYATEQDHAAAAASSAGYVCSMPATILKLSRTEGQLVEDGDLLLTMESMKMEIKIYAQSAGKLSYFVKAGQIVGEGTTLCSIE